MSRYDDIIDMPHHTSTAYPRMARQDRAAQFAPFAAMVGHDAAIAETARSTEKRISLDENAVAELDERIRTLSYMADCAPKVSVTYFKADPRKSGGAYLTVNGELEGIDEYEKVIKICGISIPFSDIFMIDSTIFNSFEE